MALYHDIPNPSQEKYVMHVDLDMSNFDKNNLAWCSLNERKLFEGLKRNTYFHGVYLKPNGYKYRWVSTIHHNYQTKVIGFFETDVEAAQAYNRYVETHKLNRPLNSISEQKEKEKTASSMPGEVWEIIPDSNHVYAVSNLGRVKRIESVSGSRRVPERILKPILYENKPPRVSLGRSRKVSIPELVAQAFLQEPPSKHHRLTPKDGDMNNCCADNLEWRYPVRHLKRKYGYGVSKVSSNMKPWKVEVKYQGSSKYLGCFESLSVAKAAYNEFVKTNDLPLPLNEC